jgi:hypothetical protein
LIYGRGSAAKARFALAVALEPRFPTKPTEEFDHYVGRHAGIKSALPIERSLSEQARILVVSFLYGSHYYVEAATDFFSSRFGLSKTEASELASSHLTVHAFYPGHVDPETLVDEVRHHLDTAKLEGKAYTGVVVDGVHNLLMQFPLLEREPLLWPTLFRLFRSEGLDAISTFTFFKVAKLGLAAGIQDDTPPHVLQTQSDSDDVVLHGPERLFFHLLVSNCDYTFLVEQLQARPPSASRGWMRVRLVGTVDGFRNGPEEFWWDPEALKYRQEI